MRSRPQPGVRPSVCCCWLRVCAGGGGLFATAFPRATCPIQLVDATPDAGIRFVHYDGSSGQKYIVETVTAGLALFDYDGDGDEDIYFLNGRRCTVRRPARRRPNALYRNQGGWRFTDVTERSRRGRHGLRAGRGRRRLRQRRRPGPVRQQLRPERPVSQQRRRHVFRGDASRWRRLRRHGRSGSLLPGHRPRRRPGPVRRQLRQVHLREPRSSIWDRDFPRTSAREDINPNPTCCTGTTATARSRTSSEESGIGLHAGTGMGMVCGDFDNDGDTDIFVFNDVAANFLFDNDGTGKFEEVGLVTGTARTTATATRPAAWASIAATTTTTAGWI